MKFIKRKTSENCIVCAIDGEKCRLQYFDTASDRLNQVAAGEFQYADLKDLESQLISWCKQNNIKNTPCVWVLGRELYQTYHTEAPNVLEKEMPQAIKWQIKDQLDFAVNHVLVSHYQPKHADPLNLQIVAVAVEKKLVESLIFMSVAADLEMKAIEIEELVIGHALRPHLIKEKIVGFVGQDNAGLVFNFYSGDELAFTRHKKGQFMPPVATQEFSLDADREAQEESFLLETQRTLDYVVSQLFRRPVDKILLQFRQGEEQQTDKHSLAETIQQITETPVISVAPEIISDDASLLSPNLSEVGGALRMDN